MSGPDGIDERFGTLVGELRSGEQTASPELRERVRTIAARGPEPPGARPARRDWFPRRRAVLVLAPVCALVAVAVGAGLLTSGGGGSGARTAKDGLTPASLPPASDQNVATGGTAQAELAPLAKPQLPATGPQLPGANAFSDAPAPSGSRHQLYSADLRLRVSDLSGTTKQAIGLTRGWGG